MDRRQHGDDKGFGLAIALLICALVLLALVAGLLPERSFRWLLSEEGPVEQFALVSWLLAAAVFSWGALSEGAGANGWLAAWVCLAAGMREADLHKKLTDYSVLKLHFYTRDAFPLWERLLAALVVVPIGIALFLLAASLVRCLLAGGLRRGSVKLVLVTIGLLVLSKLLDRAPAVVLDWYAIDLPHVARRWMLAYEEGIEALLPVAFVMAFLLGRKERRQGAAAPPRH